MQRFLEWLGKLLFADKAKAAKQDLRATNSYLRAAQIRRRTSVLQEDEPQPRTKASGEETRKPANAAQSRIIDGGPGKNILANAKFIREDSGTHETLKIVDADLVDTGEESGFDPYNTGRYDRSANWSKRTRQ